MTTGKEKGGRVPQERSTVSKHYRMKPLVEPVIHSLRSSVSKLHPTSLTDESLEKPDANDMPPTLDDLSKTVKRLEKGFLGLADAVIAEIEGMREDSRCWQEEREELWKTIIALHSRELEIEPINHRLEGLEKRACDIEKHLQSRDPDTGGPTHDRLDELERRAYELEKQLKKTQSNLMQGPQHACIGQLCQENPTFKEELTPRSNLLELQRLKLEGSGRLTASRNMDSGGAIKAVRREIEDLRTTSRNGELQQTELQYNVSAITHDLHKLQVWCKLFETDQAMRLQRLTDSMTEAQ